ncbi:putative MutS-related protein involved in mismatch repair [Phytophthora cinnamomi]|uniref:putative MutS-related protein involved in mismatch repair n=1 Tax=Phytophthora cinnamomi TaxID=4785 RepID=UPI00355A11D1|nr:putative MutS-related protein involved in mismatch repair [Phytophthora cinnamomi]
MGWGKNRRGSASSAASSRGRGGRRRPPAEPTEQDIARCVQQSAARVRVSLQLTAEVDSPSLRDVLAGFERDLETRREPAAAHGLDARVELLECGLGSWQQLVALQRVVAALQRQNRPPLAAKTTLRHDAKYDEWTLALSFARAADDALWTLASGLVLRLKSGGVPARVLLPAHRLALPLASAFVEGHIGEYQWEGRLTWRQAVVEGIGDHREEIQRVLLPPSRDNSTSGEDPPAAVRYPELVPVVEDMLKGTAGARKPVVVILRGIPGSGKSTLRREIEAICRHGGVAFTACSADFFFETPRGYVFDARKLGAAHSKCRGDFTRAVHGEIPRNQGAGNQRRPHQHVVLVDNTSTQRWEYEPYEDIARSSGCRVHIVEMKCPDVLSAYRMGQRNSHGVPPDKVVSMFMRWEDDPRAHSFTPQFEHAALTANPLSDGDVGGVTYLGLFLDEDAEQKMLTEIPLLHPNKLADHVTLFYRPNKHERLVLRYLDNISEVDAKPIAEDVTSGRIIFALYDLLTYLSTLDPLAWTAAFGESLLILQGNEKAQETWRQTIANVVQDGKSVLVSNRCNGESLKKASPLNPLDHLRVLFSLLKADTNESIGATPVRTYIEVPSGSTWSPLHSLAGCDKLRHAAAMVLQDDDGEHDGDSSEFFFCAPSMVARRVDVTASSLAVLRKIIEKLHTLEAASSDGALLFGEFELRRAETDEVLGDLY